MSGTGGTIDSVAIEISKLLRPLETQLSTTAGARAFFAQMGFTLSDAQVGTVAAPFATLAGNTGDLVKITTAIIEAIEAEDYGTLTAKGIEAIQRIVQVVDAISTLGSSMAGIVALPADQVAKRIFDYLVFVYLKGAPQINDVLELLGLLEREDHNQDSVDPANPPFSIINYRSDQIGTWFSDAGGKIRTLYGWGDNTFDGTKLFAPIERILARSGLPVL
ncbi:MAG TPA: hypothetical protein VH439_12740, partial [Gemmatimonadales bacterium]